MKGSIFIDTWGWIVLNNKREPRHEEINKFYQGFRDNRGTVYTTDYVLDETITLLFRRLPFSLAKKSLSFLDKAITLGYLCLELITPERFEQAKKLRLKIQDKPKISFTDLTSMVVMQETGLREILTDDEHFMQVGMGFKRIP
ncbi:MAG TPA: PIN domain-containing protein [Nitrospirae bacterium]|nr:PIN domain-containing protein [Nitrospirota bacterium]